MVAELEYEDGEGDTSVCEGGERRSEVDLLEG